MGLKRGYWALEGVAGSSLYLAMFLVKRLRGNRRSPSEKILLPESLASSYAQRNPASWSQACLDQ